MAIVTENGVCYKDDVDWNSMLTAEVIAYLDEQRTTSETDFDLQHPNLYFDQRGRAHGASTPDEECYYATRSGKVYKLDSRADVDRVGESPNSDANLLSNYVGETTRRIK